MEPMKIENDLIDEYTSPCTVIANKNETVLELMRKMGEYDVRHIPVVENNKAIGLVTERDLKLVINLATGRALTADEVMITEPFVVNYGESLRDVVFEMSRRKVGSALVLDARSEDIGIFTSTDALNALVEVLTV